MLGALGAHALRSKLDPSALHAFETAVTYQFFHSIAVCIVAVLLRSTDAPIAAPGTAAFAGYAFVAGIVLFSGSLYVLSLGGPRWFGPVTPIGGVAFIAGWIALAVAALRG